MTLEELLQNIQNPHIGSAGTKDYGISEFISDAMNIPRNAAGGSETGIVGQGGLIDNGVQDYAPDYSNAQTTVNSALKQKAINDATRAAAAASGGNGGGTVIDTGSKETPEQRAAREEYERKKAAIQSRLQVMKEEAGRQRGAAKSGYDFTTGEIEKNYGKLKNLNTEKLIEALQTIGQTEGDVQQTYSQTGGNARRAMESALTRNRMLYRALGALGSSFYANAQSNTTAQGANAVNDADLEEAQKLSAIGTQKATTSTDYGQNEVTIGAEESSLKNQALKEYNDALANADNLEKSYNIDSTEAIAEADSKLTSALEAIQKYTSGGYKGTADTAATQATSGAAANYAKNYDYGASMRDTLNKNSGLDSATKTIASLGDQGTSAVAGSQNTSALEGMIQNIKNKKKKQEDTTGYFQNYA